MPGILTTQYYSGHCINTLWIWHPQDIVVYIPKDSYPCYKSCTRQRLTLMIWDKDTNVPNSAGRVSQGRHNIIWQWTLHTPPVHMAFVEDLEKVVIFKHLGYLLLFDNNDPLTVRANLKKAQWYWTCISCILWAENSEPKYMGWFIERCVVVWIWDVEFDNVGASMSWEVSSQCGRQDNPETQA